MSIRESITLLHISDPQFGKFHRFAAGELFQRLVDDLPALEAEGVRPEVLVVSGDLAEWGLKDEFKDSLEFLVKLTERLEIPRRRVVVVPGNHDINRKLCEAYFLQCEGDGKEPERPYWPKWKHYESMFREFYSNEKGISFTVDEPWTLWEMSDLEMVVAGLNSTMAESHQEGTHYGWVDEKQFRWFAGRLEEYKKRGWFRLAVVHHNAQRGAVDDDENLRDADDLKRLLGPTLNLLLHGHTHTTEIGWLRRDLPVLSTGSAALKVEIRPAEVPNQYQAIRLWPDRMERWTRRYEPAKKNWFADTSGSEDRQSWHTVQKVDFRPAAKPPREEPPERMDRDDFLSRVAAVVKLRYRGAEVEERRPDYIRVSCSDGPMVRVFPVAVCERATSEVEIARLRREVFATFWAHDPALHCELVCGGDPPPIELVRKAAGEGVRIVSFPEFQGIIDFRGYVERQTAKLNADKVYPPKLYVDQKLTFGNANGAAFQTVVDWLSEPNGRFVLLLGDFGAGKTFLLHEIARRLQDHLRLTPVLIEMRALEKARTLQELVAQHLAAAGETQIDLEAFPYMLKEGRIALLFDGFDELAQRVTYQRAAEHFDTLIQAAGGRAKVVVTCRTQHFESDRQVFERIGTLPGLRRATIEPFDEAQIVEFLEKLSGEPKAAVDRFALIRDIQDLLGLSHNPRMLSFIANLPPEQLRDAQARTGKITPAELYRLLIERWLRFEYERHQPKGSAPSLTIEQRWHAATAIAVSLWGRIERTIRLSELTEEVGRTLKEMDVETATHMVGSGTLLVRDEEGKFGFVHQSILEWLVANHAVNVPDVLARGTTSTLMVDFYCDLAGRKEAVACARKILKQETAEESKAKTNAKLVLDRLQEKLHEASFAGQDLSGKSFAGSDLAGVDFTGATLENADFQRANLSFAKMDGVRANSSRMLGADLRGASFRGASLRRAKLVGARTDSDTLQRCDTFGAALPDGAGLAPMVSASSPCTSAVFSPDGALIASGHSNGAVRIWEAGSGQLLRSFKGHRDLVTSVAFSPDGLRLASVSHDDTVRLWDAGSGQLSLEWHDYWVTSVGFSPDGLRLASASDDQIVKLWDAGSGQLLRSFEGHHGRVNSVAFSPDGLRLAFASDDRTVRLWDTRSGQLLRSFEGHQNQVTSAAFSPDGLRLAFASDDRTVRLWDAGSGQLLRSFEGHQYPVTSVAFSPDGLCLASASDDQTVRLWDAGSERLLGSFEGHKSPVKSVAFSPDGLRLVSASYDSTVRLWDVKSGQMLRSLEGHHNPITTVAFAPDGLRLASAGRDKSVRLWEAGSGQLLRFFEGHQSSVNSVAFSPDGLRLASTGDDQTVRLWEAGSGQLLRIFEGHQSSVDGVAFSPDGLRLASASSDRTVRQWDAASGQLLRSFEGHHGPVASVAFSPDGLRLASAGHDQTVRLWHAGSGWGQRLRAFEGHQGPVTSVAFSPDGLRLASASYDQTLRLWDAVSGEMVRAFEGHQGPVTSVAFSPDGLRLASAGHDQTVLLWHAGSGEALRTFTGHQGWVTSLAFSPDGRRLISGGHDNTVKIWDVESGTLLTTLLATHEGWALFTPDGRYKTEGNLGGAFWYAVGLCRFEPAELDEFLPARLRRLPLDAQVV